MTIRQWLDELSKRMQAEGYNLDLPMTAADSGRVAMLFPLILRERWNEIIWEPELSNEDFDKGIVQATGRATGKTVVVGVSGDDRISAIADELRSLPRFIESGWDHPVLVRSDIGLWVESYKVEELARRLEDEIARKLKS